MFDSIMGTFRSFFTHPLRIIDPIEYERVLLDFVERGYPIPPPPGIPALPRLTRDRDLEIVRENRLLIAQINQRIRKGL